MYIYIFHTHIYIYTHTQIYVIYISQEFLGSDTKACLWTYISRKPGSWSENLLLPQNPEPQSSISSRAGFCSSQQCQRDPNAGLLSKLLPGID